MALPVRSMTVVMSFVSLVRVRESFLCAENEYDPRNQTNRILKKLIDI